MLPDYSKLSNDSLNEKIAEHIMSGKLLDYTGNWNHWRQVEEKILGKEQLAFQYINRLRVDDSDMAWRMMFSDLRTRCIAALLSLPPSV